MKRFNSATITGIAAALVVPLVGAPAGHAADLPSARGITNACPTAVVDSAGFRDVSRTNVHRRAIDCMVHWGIATGQTETTYNPGAAVTREQMASFISRTIFRSEGTLPEPTTDHFADDDASTHELSIDRLAEAGIVGGTGAGRFSPTAPVSRAQLAAFVTRAYDYRMKQERRPDLPVGDDYFTDDDGNALELQINKAAAAGFTGGYGNRTFRPGESVRRDQMASFLARVMDPMAELGVVVVPTEPNPL